ncbi:MAG: hypothetical protein GEEBNDBF_01348 [bacterium]|nr:hypothetical protein [bacterium]
MPRLICRLCRPVSALRGPGAAGRGFTLIEMLTVAAIMTILATVSLAYLREARIQANEASALGALNQLQNAYEQYWMTNGKTYPHYQNNGQTDIQFFHYRNPQALFQGLVNEGLLPQRYSGFAYNTPDLLTPGYQLVLFPFDRPGVDTANEDPSMIYAVALQPIPGSYQRNTVAIINGRAYNRDHTARYYKLPNRSVDLTTASIYAFADGGG